MHNNSVLCASFAPTLQFVCDITAPAVTWSVNSLQKKKNNRNKRLKIVIKIE